MGVLDDKRVEIVQSFGQQHRDDVGMKNGRVIRPAQHLHNVGTEWTTELYWISTRNHEFSKINDDGDLARRLFTPEQGLEIERTQQITIDELERGPRFARLQSGNFFSQDLIQPVSPVLGASAEPDSPPAIVVKDNVVVREHDGFEECLQRE